MLLLYLMALIYGYADLLYTGRKYIFHNHFDWQKIVNLIKTVGYNEINHNRYWTGLTLDTRNGLNGEDAEFAKALNIAGNLKATFHFRVFHTHVYARKTLNPSTLYIF